MKLRIPTASVLAGEEHAASRVSRVFLARFPNLERLEAAASAAHGEGFLVVEAWSTNPSGRIGPAVDEGARLPLSIGATAGLVAFGGQWYVASQDWPIRLGGTEGESSAGWLPLALLVALVVAAAIAWARLVFSGRERPAPEGAFALALSTDVAGFDHRDATRLMRELGALSVGYAELRH